MSSQEKYSIDIKEGKYPMDFLGNLKPLKNLEELCQGIKESLLMAEERFCIAVEHMADWEYWIGPEGNYIFISPACERITGHKPEEFIKDPDLFLKITHPEDRENLVRHLKEEQNGQAITPLDFRIINCRGEERYISHKCQRVFDSAGIWLGIRATNKDLSDMKLSEKEKQELLKCNQNYARSIESIGKLAMESVNNFNNMLQKILGCAELVHLESNSQGLAPHKKSNESDNNPSAQIQPVPDKNACSQKSNETIEDEKTSADYDLDAHGKILIVDDEQFILEMAADMLKIVNFEVILACTGTEAIDQFQKHKDEITCVILDLNLPDREGKSVFEEMSKTKEGIPFIISSGCNENDFYLRFGDLPSVLFLQKPYHFSTLVAKVNELMSRQVCALT